VLVIDDEEKALVFLQEALSGQGYAVTVSNNGEDGLACYAERPFDLVLLDVRMPRMDGFEVLRRLREMDAEAKVVIMTGYSTITSAVQATKIGAADYLAKPLDLERLKVVLTRVLQERQHREELDLLQELLSHQGSFHGLVGISSAMQGIYGMVRQLADSDTTVLIQGETGTGKELVARAIHQLSPRRERGFMAVHCGALSENILESELFGHEKGAFTGAIRQKRGLVEQAAGGTLFLDEIGTMSAVLQIELLRAIQEREVRRVGGDQAIPVDFRLVAATKTDLRNLMESEAFRADLFYRLSVVTIELPPLRERQGDIPLLAEHFLRAHAEKSNRECRGFTPEAMQVLQAYTWPGNVRELENMVEEAAVLGTEGQIRVTDLSEYLINAMLEPGKTELHHLPLREAREAFERQYFGQVLELAGGVVAEAARMAGIPRQFFYKKIKHYGISYP